MRTCRGFIAGFLIAWLAVAAQPARAGVEVVSCIGGLVVGTGINANSENVSSVVRNSTGNYTVTLTTARSARTSGVVHVSSDQALFAWGEFADATHITVISRNSSGTLTDFPGGSKVTIVAWQ